MLAIFLHSHIQWGLLGCKGPLPALTSWGAVSAGVGGCPGPFKLGVRGHHARHDCPGSCSSWGKWWRWVRPGMARAGGGRQADPMPASVVAITVPQSAEGPRAPSPFAVDQRRWGPSPVKFQLPSLEAQWHFWEAIQLLPDQLRAIPHGRADGPAHQRQHSVWQVPGGLLQAVIPAEILAAHIVRAQETPDKHPGQGHGCCNCCYEKFCYLICSGKVFPVLYIFE